jgi:catechol 2,3-dioxygenase-like lactoylglutathione lyase family enzyme
MMNETTPPAGELLVTHFLVVCGQDRSRDFYRAVFGAEVVRDRDPVILARANTGIVLNVGGGPTTTSRRSGSLPPPTRTSPAGSSISGSGTSPRRTGTGRHGAPPSSPSRRITGTRSAPTSAIRTAI